MKVRTSRSRVRRFGAATAVLGITVMLLSTGSLLAQTDVKIPDVKVITSGGSDQVAQPPRPTCDHPMFTSNLVVDADGFITEASRPRFGTSPELLQVLDVPSFAPVGPGGFSLNEVITLDGHRHRATWPDQVNEQLWFEFLLDGVSQGRTALTPDVPDAVRTGWMIADMGVVELPNGADTLRVHHAGINPAEINSVVLYGLCGRLTPTRTTTTTATPNPLKQPTTSNTQDLTTTSIARRQTTSTVSKENSTTLPPTTTAPETTTTATTEPSTSTTATTEPPTSTTATTEPSTSTTATTEQPTSTTATTEPSTETTESAESSEPIEPEVEGQVELADTGINGDLLASVGLITIVLGLALVAIGQAMAPTTVAHSDGLELTGSADSADAASVRSRFGWLALAAIVAGIVVVSRGRSAR